MSGAKDMGRFELLFKFVSEQMRMSHIYQPVMLIQLLKSADGSASVTEIAKALMKYDDAHLEYYEQVTKNMVGRVLTKNRGITEKRRDRYFIKGFRELRHDEVTVLVHLCLDKIKAFIDKRGDTIWSYHRRSSGYISGTVRYEVLKAAKGRCLLCGVAAEEKQLHVDHIIPRSKGGPDDLSNLQALCYTCNTMKGARDDTDLTLVVKSYKHRCKGCVFCDIPKRRVVGGNELAVAIRDKYPVTEHHTLVIPKRHVPDYFDLHQPERNAIQQLLEEQRGEILDRDSSVTGFNIGNNVGKDAGQTVHHCHTHLIPRREGDTCDPRGGVRGVIPCRQKY